MKKQAKQRMKKRRDRFVVGYLGASNLVLSSRKWEPIGGGSIEPMTLLQAERLLDKMPCANCAIFEMVPVKVNR